MPQWRSQTVSLLALGATAGVWTLSSAMTPDYRRNGYATREACLRDYPSAVCEGSSIGSYGGYSYYGPWYRGRSFFWPGVSRASSDPGPGASAVNGRSALAQPTATIRRGGFGSSGRGRYSGGFRG